MAAENWPAVWLAEGFSQRFAAAGGSSEESGEIAGRNVNAPIPVRLKRLFGSDDLPLPTYETEGAAGMDLRAAVCEAVEIAPGARAAIPTGLQIALPAGYEAQIRPRSGLARKFGVGMVNAPGTIDADYRGEILVLLINHGHEPFVVQRGDRIAQMVIAPIIRVAWQESDELDITDRGAGGFGHTGVQ